MLGIGDFKANSAAKRDVRFCKPPALPMALGAGHEAWAAGQAPKAKSVIVLWLWGGPSHIDMFDPSRMPSDFRGPFGTIPRVPGMHFTELLPKGSSVRTFSVIAPCNRATAVIPARHGGAHGFEERPRYTRYGSIVETSRARRGARHSFILATVSHAICRDALKAMAVHWVRHTIRFSLMQRER